MKTGLIIGGIILVLAIVIFWYMRNHQTSDIPIPTKQGSSSGNDFVSAQSSKPIVNLPK